jgi:hypothetical protein
LQHQETNEPKQLEAVMTIELKYKAMSWDFDGAFQVMVEEQSVNCTVDDDDPFPIDKLSLFPLQNARTEERQLLKERGRKFWECRKMKYVAYEGWDYEQVEYHVSLVCA